MTNEPFVLKILHMNVLGRRFDYGKTWTHRRGRIFDLILKVKPDVVTAVECQVAEAHEISAATGMKFINYLGSTVFYSKSLSAKALKKYPWLKGFTHSALVVEIKNSKGQAVNIAASHLPPFAYRASLRKTQQKTLCNLFNGWSDASFIFTDANWSKTFESFVSKLGWWSARTTATSRVNAGYKTSSKTSSTLFKPGSPIDYAIRRSGDKVSAKFLYYEVISGVGKSDHNFLLVKVQAGADLPKVPTT